MDLTPLRADMLRLLEMAGTTPVPPAYFDGFERHDGRLWTAADAGRVLRDLRDAGYTERFYDYRISDAGRAALAKWEGARS